MAIEAHGGQIWVESKGEGQGSMFYFTLPVSSEDITPLNGGMYTNEANSISN